VLCGPPSHPLYFHMYVGSGVVLAVVPRLRADPVGPGYGGANIPLMRCAMDEPVPGYDVIRGNVRSSPNGRAR